MKGSEAIASTITLGGNYAHFADGLGRRYQEDHEDEEDRLGTKGASGSVADRRIQGRAARSRW